MIRHFLQSEVWADFQKIQGKKVFSDHGKDWSFTAVLETGSSRFAKNPRIYVPYGPTAKNLSSLKEALGQLSEIAKENKAAYIRLEPIGNFSKKDLESLGLVKATRSIQPPQTWQLDLTQSKDQILKSMSGTNRNLFNTAASKGMKFDITHDEKKLPIFLKMIHNMASRTGMRPHSDHYFNLMAKSLFPSRSAGLAMGYYENKPIVSALFFDDQKAKTRYYAHAGSFDEARKLQANSPLLTWLIMNAKDRGMKTFDFYGVSPPDDPKHAWAGFSKFKRSFGGYDKEFSGTWEYPINQLNYKILAASRKLAGRIKR